MYFEASWMRNVSFTLLVLGHRPCAIRSSNLFTHSMIHRPYWKIEHLLKQSIFTYGDD